MASCSLLTALACLLLLLGVIGLPSTHADSAAHGDDLGAGDHLPSDPEEGNSDTTLEGQHSQHGVQRSYHQMQMGYGGYGGQRHGHGLDLYSSLAIFSFAIFLGYLLYNYIRTQQTGRRSLTPSDTDDVWSLANSIDFEAGTHLASRVLSSLELWDDALHTLPNNPSLVDVITLVTRRLF